MQNQQNTKHCQKPNKCNGHTLNFLNAHSKSLTGLNNDKKIDSCQ